MSENGVAESPNGRIEVSKARTGRAGTVPLDIQIMLPLRLTWALLQTSRSIEAYRSKRMRDKKTTSIQFSFVSRPCKFGVLDGRLHSLGVPVRHYPTNKNDQESQRNGRFESAQQSLSEASRPSTRTIAEAKK